MRILVVDDNADVLESMALLKTLEDLTAHDP